MTDGKVAKIVESESATLATMGTGDVLSGIIGGYAAAGATAFEAAVAGAYLNSRIGDLLAMEKGNHILASDIVDKIPRLIKDFDEVSDMAQEGPSKEARREFVTRLRGGDRRPYRDVE